MIKFLSLLSSPVLLVTLATAQMAPLSYQDLPQDLDSGYLTHRGAEPGVIYSESLRFAGADWLRLDFGIVNLPEGSYLRLTGIKDQVHQRLDANSLQDYANSSCFFNGDEVLLELIAAPGSRGNRVEVASVSVGQLPAEPDTICGDLDDRQLSFDNRQGRLSTGCTGWMIGPDLALSAGHCGATDRDLILSFNVPLSTSTGSLRASHPDDQYPYHVIEAIAEGVGVDWGIARLRPNSNTGLLPPEAYGEGFYELGPIPNRPNVDQIRITGYGSVSSSSNLPRSFTQVQKTHEGPLAVLGGTFLQYVTDTTGGNSGSPVIDVATGMAVGIHTHGGCSAGGGQNSGTRVDRNDLVAAIDLASPPGVPGETRSFGSPCPGSGGLGLLSLVNMPLIGKPLRVNVGGVDPFQAGGFLIGNSSTEWAAADLGLPLDLTGFGLPGCNLFVSPNRTIAAVTGFGFLAMDIPIPDAPALIGESFYIQFFYFDNLMGLFRFSNGNELTIGG